MKNNDYELYANHNVNAQAAHNIKKIEFATNEHEKEENAFVDVRRKKQFFNAQQSHYQSINGMTKLIMILCGVCVPLFVALIDSLTLRTVAAVICTGFTNITIVKTLVTIVIVIVYLAIEIILAALIAKGEDVNDWERTTSSRKLSLKIIAAIVCVLPAALYYVSKTSLLAQLPQQNIAYIHAQTVVTYIICALSIAIHMVAIVLFKYTALAWQYIILYLVPKKRLEKEEWNIGERILKLRKELVSDYYPAHDQNINAIGTIQKLSPEIIQEPITMSPKAVELRQRLNSGSIETMPANTFSVSKNLMLVNQKQ